MCTLETPPGLHLFTPGQAPFAWLLLLLALLGLIGWFLRSSHHLHRATSPSARAKALPFLISSFLLVSIGSCLLFVVALPTLLDLINWHLAQEALLSEHLCDEKLYPVLNLVTTGASRIATITGLTSLWNLHLRTVLSLEIWTR